MGTIYDFLYLRRPPLNYVCPPICEVLFSASGFPIIVLDPFSRRKVTGLVVGGVGNFRLSWNRFPGAICYTVYKALDANDPFGPYMIIAECIDGNGNGGGPCAPDFACVDLEVFGSGCYRISAITPEGESELSDPNCDVGIPNPPVGDQTVTVLATSPDAYEIGEIPGAFTIFRTGDTSNPVTVQFSLTGTAVEGTDYQTVGGSAFMAGGVTSVVVTITPINNLTVGPDLSVDLALVDTPNYTVGSPSSATVTIHQAAASAPCSLFEDDDTVYGTIDLNGSCPFETDGFVCSISSLDIGSYVWEYVGGAYTSAGLWWVVRTAGCSGLTNQIGHRYFDGVEEVPGGLNYLDFVNSANENHPSEAAAAAEYAAQVPNGAGTLFVKEDGGIARVKTCIQTDPNFAEFRLRRILKLVNPQPLTLQIQNFSAYADGRFVWTYNSIASAPIAFDASAATVETALNAMSSVIADGGVTCAGTLAGGLSITWNVNGDRNQSTSTISTVNPGITAVSTTTQQGTGIQPEIQLLTVGPFCADFKIDNALPEYGGEVSSRDLSVPEWFETESSAIDPDVPTRRQSNFEYLDTRVKLVSGPAAPGTATVAAAGGAGNVDLGAHKWKITFVTLAGESGGNPESNELVLGGASQVNLTDIPIGPVGTTARNVYRTVAGGTVYFLVDTIANNIDTIYTDDTDDATIFNSGFGTQIPPASCFWCMAVICVIDIGGFLNLPSVIWAGTKLTGDTAEGEYLLSFPFGGLGGNQCPVEQQANGGLTSITLSGTF